MATRERVILPSGVVDAGKAGIVAPFQFTVSGEDVLRWRTYATWDIAQGFVSAELSVRMIRPGGDVQLTKVQHTHPVPGNFVETVVPLGVGAIINVAVRYLSATIVNAAVYDTVHLERGTPPGATTLIGQLLGGYIGPGRSLAWPGSPIEPWWGHSGAFTTVALVGGGPGTEASASLHSPYTMRVCHARGFLTTSAAPGTRLPQIVVTSFGGAVEYFRLPILFQQTASLGILHMWARGYSQPGGSPGGQVVGPWPLDIVLPMECTISTFTGGILAGDLWQNVALFGEILVGPAVADG